MKKLISIFVLVILFSLRFEEFKACTQPPPDSPSVTIQRYSPNTACIIIYRYTSFGADSTNFCGCALNSVAPIISVDAVLITDSNNVPIPGFPFVFNPNTGPSFNSHQPGNWKGFFSDIQQLIPSNIPLKIQIMVTIPPNTSSIDQLQLLATNLASLPYFFASDEVNSNGMVLNTHLQFRPAGTITILGGPVDLLDANQVLISSHTSIQAAYNAIPGTITQSYFIELLPAYVATNDVYPINLTLKSGHSATNKITIRPASGNTGEVISGSSTTGILTITDADYIVIDGRPGGSGSTTDLIIRNTVTTGTSSNTITLINGATNCVVRYCRSFNATQGSAGPRNIEFATSAANISGNSDNVIENCFISGGRSSIGCDGTTANPNRNNKILNDTITDFSFAGIWLLTAVANDWLIEGNTIDQVTGYNITNPTAINLGSTLSANIIIRKNKIMDVRSTSTSTGLIIRSISTVGAPSAGTRLTIENNFISQTVANTNVLSTYGILTTGTINAYTANIYYNTILIGGTQVTGAVNRIVSAGIINNTTIATAVFNIRNNIVINRRSGGPAGVKHTAAAYNDLNPDLNIDYNCYFATANTDGYHVTLDSVGYNNLEAYKTAIFPNEQNSRFKDVTFVSNTDLHLAVGSTGDPDLSARPISGITTDIDGDLRSTGFPYKGADESTPFTLKTLNLIVNLEACSPMQDTIIVSLRNTTAPFGLIEMTKVYLSPTGTATVNFAKAVNGVSYYIVVNHRNSIETWSKLGEVFTAGVLNYDFTSAASQAFGNNMVIVGSEWSFYSGDVTQDGVVDGADLSAIDNDAFNFVTGYVVTDLNCDGVVDGTDAAFADNNAANFVTVIRP